MARPTIKKPSQQKITPLWIVAAFLTLTEVVTVYAVTQTTNGVQVALTVFVIVFALLVTTAFFIILWNRPWVFYAPTEYGDVNPKDFMSAMRDSPLVADQVKLAMTVEDNPFDLDARFSLVDTMADDVQCQWIILMHEKGIDAPRHMPYIYEYKHGGAGNGTFDVFGRNKMEGTGLVHATGGSRFFTLTQQGHQFAEWLIKKGRKCDYFWTPSGSWGTPEPGGSAEKWLQERIEKAKAPNQST